MGMVEIRTGSCLTTKGNERLKTNKPVGANEKNELHSQSERKSSKESSGWSVGRRARTRERTDYIKDL